ncbi:MAG: hypothetical protein J5720_00415 [Bacteroidaceae bacterium]|nr:hypothetical protein [Bacteroidaceae bacterium]
MRWINIILAALLLLCLAPMPYGYYQVVRFVSMVIFAVMAYRYWTQAQKGLAVTFGALALLFQPIFKVALGRMIWNIVDVVVAIGLIVLVFLYKEKE